MGDVYYLGDVKKGHVLEREKSRPHRLTLEVKNLVLVDINYDFCNGEIGGKYGKLVLYGRTGTILWRIFSLGLHLQGN